jgi:glycosyltransferase involved in cell wall biosynthesis
MPTTAGVPTVLLGYVMDQLERGWSVSVACPSDGWLAAAAAEAGAQVLPWAATRAPGPGVARETARLAQLIGSQDPDLVHLHSAKAGVAGRLAVRGRRATVFQPHAWSFLAVDGAVRAATVRWERFAARWTDALVCVSEAEKQAGLDAGVRAWTRVIPNGVDCSTWTAAGAVDRAAARSRLGLPDRPLVVCVGRLCDQKGQADLVDAWTTVRQSVPAPELMLVGDGPGRAQLQSQLAGVSDIGLVGEREDVAEWLAAADVVAVPSRWDGMALVLLEAMARARSIVATDVAGVVDALPNSAGAVVSAGDRAALARELTVRLLDPPRADAEGAAGREHVQRHHDRADAAAALVRVYSALLDRRQSSASDAPSPAPSEA